MASDTKLPFVSVKLTASSRGDRSGWRFSIRTSARVSLSWRASALSSLTSSEVASRAVSPVVCACSLVSSLLLSGATMSQQPSLTQSAHSVRQVLTAYNLEHENAKTELKALMPEDAKEAIGHGIRAKRSKSGAISFDILSMEGSHAPLQ